MWHGTGVVTEDGNKEAGGKDVLDQCLCQGHHKTSSFAVFSTLV